MLREVLEETGAKIRATGIVVIAVELGLAFPVISFSTLALIAAGVSSSSSPRLSLAGR